MAERTDPKQICPYLGLAADRASRFSYPESAHVCFAAERATSITLEHQSAFCLTQAYVTCPRFVEPPAEPPSRPEPLSAVPEADIQPRAGIPLWVLVLGGLASLLVVAAVFHFYLRSVFQPSSDTGLVSEVTPSPTTMLTATPTPSEALEESTPTPAAIALVATPTITSTSASDERVYTVFPGAGDVGWVASSDERGNHFGDSFLYAGIFEGQTYQAAFQLSLSSIPRGAPIRQASLQLTGLRGDRLGTGGAWTLRLLAPEIDQDWRRHTYQEIFNAPALQALSPILGDQDLAEGKPNVLELSPAQIKILETRIVEDEDPKVSFRIEGPLVAPDNLFAWDTGYGPKSQGNKVALVLRVGPPPATPPPFNYVVVTSTPTPENVLTAAAVVLQMTADATRIGTATPVPPNMATATPVPDYLVIVPTLTPENDATAQALAALATAEALTTGTPAPLPTNAVTATPVPSPTPTPTYVLITATPTPESIFAAATLSAAGTAQAQRLGIPTPLPDNWVTPIVVTSTPTPADPATAQALAWLGTAQAFTTGTPTPTPANMVTATSTPVFVLLNGELPPMTPTSTPAILPRTMPPELIGKIAFKSDRSGKEQIYVVNPDGSGLGLLSDRWPYDLAQQADAYSADGRFRVFVKDAIVDTGSQGGSGVVNYVQLKVPSLFFADSLYKVEGQITHFGADVGHLPLAYEPAWSPTAERIAFVSDDTGNDEIWVTYRDGTDMRQLTHNEWEWDKHPSWSPDGSKIVFWSNRTGHKQIWIMDSDGSNLYSLSRTGFNDWDPVWIKYPDVPG